MKIGDKVVCVATRVPGTIPPPEECFETIGPTPVVGQIYVISAFHLPSNGELGLSFVGPISSKWKATGQYVGYNSGLFRLLDELRERSTQTQTNTNHETVNT